MPPPRKRSGFVPPPPVTGFCPRKVPAVGEKGGRGLGAGGPAPPWVVDPGCVVVKKLIAWLFPGIRFFCPPSRTGPRRGPHLERTLGVFSPKFPQTGFFCRSPVKKHSLVCPEVTSPNFTVHRPPPPPPNPVAPVRVFPWKGPTQGPDKAAGWAAAGQKAAGNPETRFLFFFLRPFIAKLARSGNPTPAPWSGDWSGPAGPAPKPTPSQSPGGAIKLREV